MAGYLPDSTVVIDHARGRVDGTTIVDRPFAETGLLYTCDVITAEVLSGCGEIGRHWIGRFLEALEYVTLDPAGARWAGRRRRELALEGRRRPAADALIAALAWRLDATVVTRHPADVARYGVPVLGYGEPPQASEGTKRGSTA